MIHTARLISLSPNRSATLYHRAPKTQASQLTECTMMLMIEGGKAAERANVSLNANARQRNAGVTSLRLPSAVSRRRIICETTKRYPDNSSVITLIVSNISEALPAFRALLCMIARP